MIPYGRQCIDEEDIRSVVEVLRSDFITQGPVVEKFEKALAEFCGARFAVAFNSGTSALLAAYSALGLSEGDEFITSPITFTATANAGLWLGARPVFVDVEMDTGNIDADLIEEAVTEKTKLLSVVHYAGHPADLEKVREIARRYGLKVVEDACHALGAGYRGSRIGSCAYSDATVFSFHPVKHITTGEGGAVLTNDEDVYEKLLMFRNHGITRNPGRFTSRSEGGWYYECQLLGLNLRITDIQCALGLSQLGKLESFVRRRREIAGVYRNRLRESSLFQTPVEKDYAYHSYHLYPVLIREEARRREIYEILRSRGVGVQVHYIPVYWHPLYRNLGYRKGLCPSAEAFYRREISLPLYPCMGKEELEHVIEILEDLEGLREVS